MSSHRLPTLLFLLATTSSLKAADDLHRIPLIDDPRVAVTLLLRPTASPADEAFLGFELHNRTRAPLPLGHATHYRLDNVRLLTRGTDTPVASTSLASGNAHDLLWRDGTRRPDPPPYPDTLPPGVTRRLRYSSVYSLALLAIPKPPGLTVDGRAHFTLDLNDNKPLSTPPDGVPFHFDWLPPDPAGLTALRDRLARTLITPTDPFHDAYLLSALLASPDVASSTTLDDLLAALKRHDGTVRPSIRSAIQIRHPRGDPRVVAFALDVIRSRNVDLLHDLVVLDSLRDRRLIDPLLQWVRDDQEPYRASYFAMQLLLRHRDLLPDPTAVRAELGRLALARSRYVSKGTFPTDHPSLWPGELEPLVLTGDPALVPHLLPYLDRTDVVVNAHRLAQLNNGISTRTCDATYNAILDLLDRPDPRLTPGSLAPAPDLHLDPAKEYPRRDALISKLKQELNR